MGQDEHSPRVSILVDGQTCMVRAGDTLAAALAEAGHLVLRHSPRTGAARGAFCHMGVCQECVLVIDGQLRQACLTLAAQGMRVETRGTP